MHGPHQVAGAGSQALAAQAQAALNAAAVWNYGLGNISGECYGGKEILFV